MTLKSMSFDYSRRILYNEEMMELNLPYFLELEIPRTPIVKLLKFKSFIICFDK